MPEPSGTGTAPNPQPAGSGSGSGDPTTGSGGAGGASGAPEGGDKPVNPALQQRLSDENARLRIANRDLTQKIATFEQQIEELRQTGGAGTPTDDALKAELATLKRTVSDLTTKQKAAEEQARQLTEKSRNKTRQVELSKVITEGRITDPASALIVLERFAEVDDDDVVVLNVRDEQGNTLKVPATLENVRKHKLLSDVFFPAEGSAGTGSRGGSRQAVGGIDMNRALTDFQYFEANKDKILAARRAGA